MATSQALTKRAVESAVALMPPPPVKRIKRPPKVLDEDDYTDALSKIIARDYFPGLEESRAQNEYLAALESGNQAWIAEASQKLRATISEKTAQGPRVARNPKYDSTAGTPRRASSTADTPRGYDGSQTPMSVITEPTMESGGTAEIDISNHSLSSFQSKYTSEDNASFNDVLDNQNKRRREKHAYMWTEDQRIPTARQIAHRAEQQRLLIDKATSDAEAAKHGDKALIPLTTGADGTRSAKPDAWKVKRPDNTFMFFPDDVAETDPNLTTTQEQKELDSRAGPKETLHQNTRFPPLYALASQNNTPSRVPASPSLNTDILAHREADDYDGAATPRVNGYAYVDEDEPQPEPPTTKAPSPSYRDLLAGQAPSPSPFHLTTQPKREALHHRLVEKTASAKRSKEREALLDGTPLAASSHTDRSSFGATPGTAIGNSKKQQQLAGNMTPAAARLLQRVGKTPVRSSSTATRMSSKDLWTPTPRRKGAK
ncbi:Protein DGCR14 [Cyphellophora attinorum]|uniref:Protein DGCR14 n=1 Tax=Cyphellophora attinorum TaxID=1664694 RepID=A0A0N1HDD3_9EURO|nr:Protein DGCR14 [Phialophora attinorum]KPI42624.1 Protein DGCR14 [Phialophora attinorum]